MKKTFILIILSVLYFTATAQEHNLPTEKIFHIDLKIKEVDLNPFSDCKFAKNTFSSKKINSSTSTFMKVEQIPSQQQIRINYIHKPYVPTLMDVFGSLIYDIIEDYYIHTTPIYNDRKR